MKTTLLLKKMACVVAALLLGATAFAQNGWNAHQVKNRTKDAPAAIAPKAISDDIVLLGYAHGWETQIYQGDGFSNEKGGKIGAAILITKDMLKPYVGANVVGIRIGWNGFDFNTNKVVTGECDAFISKGINGEEIATKHTPLDFEWNVVELDNPIAITEDVTDLFVGMYAEIPAGIICIPTLNAYPQPNSCYLWDEGDVAGDGSKNWYDGSKDFRPLAFQLIVEDTDGRLANVAIVGSMFSEEICVVGQNAPVNVSIRNGGTTDISKLEVTSYYGDKSEAVAFNLSRAIAWDESSSALIPVRCYGTGTHQIAITKINGVAVESPMRYDVPLIGIPEAAAQAHKFRPLLEWFVSENDYRTPQYTDELLLPGLAEYPDQITLVSQHADDKFMTTGEENTYDDASVMLLDYMNQDSASVSLPCQMLNRTRYTNYYLDLSTIASSPAFSALYPMFSVPIYAEMLKLPTFASVNAAGTLEGQKIKITVSGNIAENVLPAGEKLNLTVYLMEKDVLTDSQIFWSDKEEDEYEGEFTHPNVIRELVTPFYGMQLENAAGAFEKTFEVDLSGTDYDKSKLSVVAFLNRDIKNGNLHAQVINSAEAPVIDPTGIQSVENGSGVTVESRNGRFQASRGTVEVYTSDGRRVANSSLNAGVYLVKVTADGYATVRKMIVK